MPRRVRLLLERLVDRSVVGKREDRRGLCLFPKLLGKPLRGEADLLDRFSSFFAIVEYFLDVGKLGGIELTEGIRGQPGVIVIVGHDWFSFL